MGLRPPSYWFGAGAVLISIDISSTSIDSHSKKATLALKGLRADVRQADAERLSFDSDTFDFVWSWGAHSSFFANRKGRPRDCPRS